MDDLINPDIIGDETKKKPKKKKKSDEKERHERDLDDWLKKTY